MRILVVREERLGARGADVVASALRAAVVAGRRATVAFSGGSTAGPLLSALADEDVPWASVDVFQVDERVAPNGHADRNLTTLRSHLVDRIPLPPDQLHAMPVDRPGLDAAATAYRDVLHTHAGRPARLDMVHLGLGPDGHTASLLPGSPLLRGSPDPVAVTRSYQGRRRMTLTPPVLSRARRVLWFVSGSAKAAIVRRLVDGDASIPAGTVETSRAILLLDPPAAAALSTGELSEDR